MKRYAIGLLILILLVFAAVTVQAEEETKPDYQGTLSLMPGTQSALGVNYRLGDNLAVVGEYQTGNPDNPFDVLKAGIDYQLFNNVGLSVGVRYDPAEQESLLYNGIRLVFPFGVNLALTGSYDYNISGVDWTRYETALRIQMYDSVYLFAGIRNDTGVVPYRSLPLDMQQPSLFLKVDGNWQWGKYGLSVQPYLYVEGILFNDYTFKYQLNDRVNLMVNYKDTFDRKPLYQAGIQWKF